MKIKKPLSTGDVARYCRVSSVTVFNWIKADKIKYHTTAGGQYRVERPDLIVFLKHYGMPVPDDLLTGDKIKILVCDDEEAFREIVITLFEKDDRFLVETAEDGFAALVMVGKFNPDLLILDVVMPNMDGVEVCERLKSSNDTKNMDILVLSGLLTDEVSAKLKQMGIKSVLQKPVKLDVLSENIFKILKLPIG